MTSFSSRIQLRSWTILILLTIALLAPATITVAPAFAVFGGWLACAAALCLAATQRAARLSALAGGLVLITLVVIGLFSFAMVFGNTNLSVGSNAPRSGMLDVMEVAPFAASPAGVVAFCLVRGPTAARRSMLVGSLILLSLLALAYSLIESEGLLFLGLLAGLAVLVLGIARSVLPRTEKLNSSPGKTIT